MSLSGISIERPVLATVISIVIILFGALSIPFLGLREYPVVDPPVISVRTDYIGANAQVIETQITEVLEESINGISGIRSLRSTSADGRSTITVEFEIGVDLDAAANDVRDKVSRSQRNLPPDSEPPIVSKSNADAVTIMALTLQSSKRDLLSLTEIANNTFKEQLQTIEGISSIRIWGEKKYSIRIQLDPNLLAGYGLTPLDVRNAIQQQNLELPSGKIEGERTELTIRTFGRLSTPEEFREMVISEQNNSIVQLKDVAEISIAPQNLKTSLRGNGKKKMVGVAVTPLPGSNHIKIADDVYNRVARLQRDIPADIEVGYAFDRTIPVRKALKEVRETIALAFLLVLIVIFVFLRDWRTTLIPVLAIPISLIGTFFVMYIFGFSINVLTLLGVVLATGLVVDDAIVMLENIYRRIENGQSPKEAGHEGSEEIYFAIIATTVTLIAVFLPVIFLEGITGRLFREFGMVVSGAIIISTIVSLSLTPMLSTKWLKKRERQNLLYRKTEPLFEALISGYGRLLGRFLKVRWVAWVTTLISAFGIYFIAKNIPRELAPMEDKSSFRIYSTAPEGTTFEAMDQFQLQVLDIIDTIPEKEAYISVTSPGFGSTTAANSSFVFVSLSDGSLRKRSQQDIVQSLYPKIGSLKYAKSFIQQSPTISVGGTGRSLPVEYVIQAPNFELLKEKIPQFMERAENDRTFSVTNLDLKFNKPELQIIIDRERTRTMGVSIRDIAETLQLLYSRQRFGYYIQNGKQYEIIGEAQKDYRDEPDDLRQIYVRNNSGHLIQLSNLVHFSEESNPPTLYRYNRYIAATISADLAPGITLADGIAAMDRIKSDVLDDRFSTALSGTSKDFQESASGLNFAFLLALALVYLALSAQFESFVDPLIIMFTVPLALIGSLLALWLFGQSLNLFSQIGIIVLIGIVTKNGILIVEFANQKLSTGMSIQNAARESAEQRLRPILMTSIATILGVLPIAVALGSSSSSRIPMGIAIIGGLILAVFLTLFIIPAIYTYFKRL